MKFVKKIRKIEVSNFKVGTFVYHPLLGRDDGIVIEPQGDWGISNHKKVYVKTKCDLVYTFCPNSLTRTNIDQIVEEIVL